METLLSLKETAEIANVSPSTLRRRFKPRLQALGSVCAPTGWQVKPAHLVAVGLIDRLPNENPTDNSGNPLQPPCNTPQNSDILISELRAQLEHERERYKELRADFERERERADRAEKRADVLLISATQRMELAPADSEAVEVEAEPQVKKRGFFARWFTNS